MMAFEGGHACRGAGNNAAHTLPTADPNNTAEQQQKLDGEFFPLNDLPNELIVSVFAAADDSTWVRHTFPCVNRAWRELFRSQDASPLHEELEVDFEREIAAATAARERRATPLPAGAPPTPLVDLPRIIPWARRYGRSVRKLVVKGGVFSGSLDAETAEYAASQIGRTLAVAAPSLTHITLEFGDLCKAPFWRAVRDHVAPAGRLRSFVARGCMDFVTFGPYLESFAQLAGSLEEIEIILKDCPCARGLPRLPESFFALAELRRLVLRGHRRLTAIPARISALKKLEWLTLQSCALASLPRELRELPRLETLDVDGNENLGIPLPRIDVPDNYDDEDEADDEDEEDEEGFLDEDGEEDGEEEEEKELVDGDDGDGEAFVDEDEDDLSFDLNLGTAAPADRKFPAELGDMKSLRDLNLHDSGLRAVPAFICEVRTLEHLTLCCNDIASLPKELGELSALTHLDLTLNKHLGTALPTARAFPAELKKIKSLRWLSLDRCRVSAVPAFVREQKSLEFFELTGCRLSSLPKELGEFSHLTKLMLKGNKNLGHTPLRRAFPASLRKIKSLREINLSECRLRAVPSFICEQKSLRSLSLDGCRLSSLPKGMGELSALTKLDLEGNESLGMTAEAFPAELDKIKSLRLLNLDGCRLRAVPSFVSKQKWLRSLSLNGCDISSLPKELGELSRLTKLDLEGNDKLGTTAAAFPAELKKIKSLRHLKLFGPLLRAVPPFVCEQKSLESLSLSLAPRSPSLPRPADPFPAELAELKSLQELDLANCAAVPAFVARLEALRTLRVQFARDAVLSSELLDSLVAGCPELGKVTLFNPFGWDRGSMAHINAFGAKLKKKNPGAKVSPWE